MKGSYRWSIFGGHRLSALCLRETYGHQQLRTHSDFTAPNESIPSRRPKPVKDLRNVASSRAVYASGLTKTGSFGLPHLIEVLSSPHVMPKPMRLAWLNAKKIKRVAAGCGFSLFASSKELYGCGLNNFYQLGGPYRTETHKRSEEWYHKGRRILLPEDAGNIVSISAGRMHSLIATTSGLYAFGDNAHGQCGQHPDQMPSVAHGRTLKLPKVDIPTDSPIKKVHCSLDTSFVLLENGELYSFGLGTDGQLGNTTEEIRWRPRRIEGDLASEKIIDISGSTDTIVAVSKAGDVFVWGQNEYRQLGLITDEPQVFMPVRYPVNLGRVVSAAASGPSCVVCNEEGIVYVWGSEVLGLGPNVTSTDRPIQLDPPLFASAVGEESRVTRVFAGNVIMGARTEPGHLFTWGSNRSGGLALGHDKDQLFPYQVSLPGAIKEACFGPDHTLLLCR